MHRVGESRGLIGSATAVPVNHLDCMNRNLGILMILLTWQKNCNTWFCAAKFRIGWVRSEIVWSAKRTQKRPTECIENNTWKRAETHGAIVVLCVSLGCGLESLDIRVEGRGLWIEMGVRWPTASGYFLALNSEKMRWQGSTYAFQYAWRYIIGK